LVNVGFRNDGDDAGNQVETEENYAEQSEEWSSDLHFDGYLGDDVRTNGGK